MENFRVGVVGCGGIAQVHGTVLQHLEGVEVLLLLRHLHGITQSA